MVGGDQLGLLRAMRRAEDVEAAVVLGRVGPEELRLAHRGLVPDDVGEGLAGLDVEVRRDLAELEVEVDDHDAIRLALGRGHGNVRRDGRGPDAALRAVDGDRPPDLGDHHAVRRDDRADIL